MIQPKDAYYFSHDSNAKDDPKCVLLIEQLGPEGYGIFWILVEMLREQPGYKCPLKLIPALSRRYNTTSEKMSTVIKGYELFTITDDMFFYSESLIRRMELWENRREQARLAGVASAQKRLEQKNNSTIVQPAFNGSSTKKGKEKKRKEKKEKENTYTTLFDIFWTEYPRTSRMSKINAFKKWEARLKEGCTPENIIEGAKGYAISVKGTEEKFIKQPETFLGPGLHFQEYLGVAGAAPVYQPDPARIRAQQLREEWENERR
jgi:hypothetical protein